MTQSDTSQDTGRDPQGGGGAGLVHFKLTSPQGDRWLFAPDPEGRPTEPMVMTIENRTGQNITLAPLDGDVTELRYHMRLMVRPGTLSSDTRAMLSRPAPQNAQALFEEESDDWSVLFKAAMDMDGDDAVYLLYRGSDRSLPAGKARKFTLHELSSAENGEARATNVDFRLANAVFAGAEDHLIAAEAKSFLHLWVKRAGTTAAAENPLDALDVFLHTDAFHLPANTGDYPGIHSFRLFIVNPTPQQIGRSTHISVSLDATVFAHIVHNEKYRVFRITGVHCMNAPLQVGHADGLGPGTLFSGNGPSFTPGMVLECVINFETRDYFNNIIPIAVEIRTDDNTAPIKRVVYAHTPTDDYLGQYVTMTKVQQLESRLAGLTQSVANLCTETIGAFRSHISWLKFAELANAKAIKWFEEVNTRLASLRETINKLRGPK